MLFFIFSILVPFPIDARMVLATIQDSTIVNPKISSKIDSLKLQVSDTSVVDSLKKQITTKTDNKIKPFQYHLAKSSLTKFSLHREEFDFLIYRHIGDIIKQLPGVELNDFVSTGLPAFIRIRGSSLNQPMIFIDGFPLSHPQFGTYDLNLLPSQGFESITLDAENESTGYPAPFGSIHLKTRKYSLKKPYTELSWHKGKHGDSEVDVAFGQKLGKETDAVGGYTLKTSEGRLLHSEYLAQKIRLQIQSRIHSDWVLNYLLFNTKGEFEYPGPVLWQPEILNLDAKQKSVLWNHFVTLRGDITGDYREDLNLKFYYNSLFQDYRDQNFDLKEISHNRLLGSHIESYFPLLSRELTVGGRTEFRWLRSETVKKVLFFDASIFSRYQFPIARILDLTTNFNLEINNKFGLFFNPHFILQNLIIPKIRIALEYQHARRLPDYFELYWNHRSLSDTTSGVVNYNQVRYLGNPDLTPEYIDNISLNLNFEPWPWLAINASPYFQYVENFISINQALQTESPTFKNQNQVYFYGYNQRLEIRILTDLKFNMTIHYLINRDENNTELPERPNLMASGLVTYRRNFFQGNLKTRFHLAARLLGERWNLINGNYPFPAYYYSSNLSRAGYEPTFDFKAVATIRDMDIFFSFENLMGRKYHYLAGFPMRELAFYWGINWKFWD